MPALIYPEPVTNHWQQSVETRKKSEPRKRRRVKLGPTERARAGPEVLIFKSKDMKQVNKRPRFQTDEQKRRTVVVRKHGACPDCNRAHRAVGTIPSSFAHSLMHHQCTHVPEEASSPATNDPTTPNADVQMDIMVVYSPLETGP